MTTTLDFTNAYNSIKESLNTILQPTSVENFVLPEEITSQIVDEAINKVKQNEPVLIQKYNIDYKELYSVILQFDLKPENLKTKEERLLRIKYLNILKTIITENIALLSFQLEKNVRNAKQNLEFQKQYEEQQRQQQQQQTDNNENQPLRPIHFQVRNDPSYIINNTMLLNLENTKNLIFRVIDLLINEAKLVDNPVTCPACPACPECKKCPACPECKKCYTIPFVITISVVSIFLLFFFILWLKK